MADFGVHRVTGVKVMPVESFTNRKDGMPPFYTRKLMIVDARGQWHEVILFADNPQALELHNASPRPEEIEAAGSAGRGGTDMDLHEAMKEATEELDWLAVSAEILSSKPARIERLRAIAAALRGAMEGREWQPKWAGQFNTFDKWVSGADKHLDAHAVCIDTKGRRCLRGADFMRARDEGAFPVRYFWEFEAPLPPESAS